jgi:hypothetical protein
VESRKWRVDFGNQIQEGGDKMAKMYENLDAWKEGTDLAVRIYDEIVKSPNTCHCEELSDEAIP